MGEAWAAWPRVAIVKRAEMTPVNFMAAIDALKVLCVCGGVQKTKVCEE